jgi:phosphatidylglycerol---prolipoprotein diacylglyceryl transferase
MYPNLYYAFQDLFGINIPALKFVNSFGFFVAISFLISAWVLSKEFKRKEGEGLLHATEQKIIVGAPASFAELLTNFILGFIFGYKLIGLFLNDANKTFDPQEYIFSSQGNALAGLLTGLVFAGLKYWEKNKHKLGKPEERIIRIWPHDRVGDIVVFAAIFGFLGAKIFHNLENWDEFVRNPIASLLSFSGLTFYGGLITAGIAISYYAKKHKIGLRHLVDAFAPTMMLAYALGRIGCQISGDGDWGILNSAYISTIDGKIQEASPQQVEQTIAFNEGFYKDIFPIDSVSLVERAAVKAPSFLPNWLFAYNYPHNVINEGVGIRGCEGQYCSQLPVPVFPTPFYEVMMCLVLFGILWMLRKRIKVPGMLFGIYLILNGLERFFIEKIRVNTEYHIFGLHPSQAELISFAMILAGTGLIIYLKKKHSSQ